MVKITVDCMPEGKEPEHYELDGAGAVVYTFDDFKNIGGAVGIVHGNDVANMLLDLHSKNPDCIMAAIRAFEDYIDNMGENYGKEAQEVKDDE